MSQKKTVSYQYVDIPFMLSGFLHIRQFSDHESNIRSSFTKGNFGR